MTEVGRFFDGVSYTESDQAETQNRFRREGVLSEVAGLLAVGVPGGMFVSVDAGEAMVQGFHYKNTASLNLAIGNNTSGSTRIDRVVLRLLRTANTILAHVIVGTPGGGLPAITQVAGGDWDYPLATVTIPTGTTSVITSGMLADVRTYSATVNATKDISIGGLISKSQLSFNGTSDNPVGSTVTTAVSLVPNQNFTVDDSNSIMMFIVRLSVLVIFASGGIEAASNLLIDGTTPYKLGGAGVGISGQYSNLGGGVVLITGLSVGTHTVNVTVSANSSGATMFCRQSSQPAVEWCQIQAMELKR